MLLPTFVRATLVSIAVVVVASCNDDEEFRPAEESTTQSSASSSASSSSAGAGGGGACADLGDVCTTCELAACPDRYCACYENPACGLLASCVLACPLSDVSCIQGCYAQHPDGISDGALLVHCAASDCPQACPGYQPLEPCTRCLYEACPSTMNTCVANAECTQLLLCLDACLDEACVDQCYADHPAGLTDAAALGTCSQRHCIEACGD